MKNMFRWGWSVLEVIIIIYVILITSLILFQNKYGYTQLGRYTFENIEKDNQSLVKNAKVGDLLVIKNNHNVKENDKVYYYAVSNESYEISIDSVSKIEKREKSDLYTIHTSSKDIVISEDRIVGTNTHVYPFLGGFLEKVQSRTGFLFFVLLPIMIVFVYQVYEFFFTVRNQRDGEEGKDFSNSTDIHDNSLVKEENTREPRTIIIESKKEEKEDKFGVEPRTIFIRKSEEDKFNGEPRTIIIGKSEEDKFNGEPRTIIIGKSEEDKFDGEPRTIIIRKSEEGKQDKSNTGKKRIIIIRKKKEEKDNNLVSSKGKHDKSNAGKTRTIIIGKKKKDKNKFKFVAEDKSDDNIEIL